MVNRGKAKKWFFTITLKPEHYVNTGVSQYEWGRKRICELINMLECDDPKYWYDDYEFIPEFTQNDNIHFHGWITTSQSNMFKTYKIFQHHVGYTLYKDWTSQCLKYMYKDHDKTSDRLKIIKIKFTNLDQKQIIHDEVKIMKRAGPLEQLPETIKKPKLVRQNAYRPETPEIIEYEGSEYDKISKIDFL